MNKLQKLHELGQSTWLNYLHRPFIQSGELRLRVTDGIQGFTANATNFDTILTTTSGYDDAIWKLVKAGIPAPQIHSKLIFHDAQIASDYMQHLFRESEGFEGYVSLELNPNLMHDTVNTVAEVMHLDTVISRPNVIIEIPATEAGIEAIKLLTKEGIRINVTHVFSVNVYEKVAHAYMEGLELYFDLHSGWRYAPVSVVSFSLSPIDEVMDPMLADQDKPKMLGKTAVSQAKVLYESCRQIFSSPAWEKLARKGANILRPKWTRTTPRNPAFPETYYIEALIGADTITTFSPATLSAFKAHGQVRQTLTEHIDEAQEHLYQVGLLGIDMDVIAHDLQQKYLDASEAQFQLINEHIAQKRVELELKEETAVHATQLTQPSTTRQTTR